MVYKILEVWMYSCYSGKIKTKKFSCKEGSAHNILRVFFVFIHIFLIKTELNINGCVCSTDMFYLYIKYVHKCIMCDEVNNKKCRAWFTYTNSDVYRHPSICTLRDDDDWCGICEKNFNARNSASTFLTIFSSFWCIHHQTCSKKKKTSRKVYNGKGNYVKNVVHTTYIR